MEAQARARRRADKERVRRQKRRANPEAVREFLNMHCEPCTAAHATPVKDLRVAFKALGLHQARVALVGLLSSTGRRQLGTGGARKYYLLWDGFVGRAGKPTPLRLRQVALESCPITE